METTPEKTLNQYLISSFSHKFEIKDEPSQKELIKGIFKLFNKKYSKLAKSYNLNIIDNIIYNEKSHIVAKFKDRLILDDNGEFLKRYYNQEEIDARLPKFFEYYNLYSKIFPNYTIFPAGKYLYQNIQKKQKMIDLQEQMELKELSGKNKIDDDDDNEKVFDTDEIDSILNGTNNEGMEIIFNVNKNNIKKDEELFKQKIKDIIEKIDDYDSKKTNEQNHNSNDIKSNYSNNNNNNNNNLSNNNDINKENHNNNNNWNQKISVPLNINYTKNKRLRNSSLISANSNNTNITYYNNIQSLMSKFFNISSANQKSINYIKSKSKNNKNNNNSKIKNCQKKEKKSLEKKEQNLFKNKKMSSTGFQKNLSQNISTSNQTQKEIKDLKDISISKKNSSIYINNKKPSTSTSSANTKKKIKKRNLNNSLSSNKMSTNILISTMIKKNNNNSKKKIDLSSMTSRNSQIIKIGLNTYKTKIKNMKGDTYYASNIITSRNKKEKIKMNRKEKASICTNVSKGIVFKNNNSLTKRNKISYNIEKYQKKIGYKELIYIRNGIKNNLKEKKVDTTRTKNSRNKSMITNLNSSQPKTNINQRSKNNNKYDSALKLGPDIFNKTKNPHHNLKFINCGNLTKRMNASKKKTTSKNSFSKINKNKICFYK